jgi:hypothetical protein
MASWIRQARANRRGAVAVWVALTLTPTLMLIALGLDEAQGSFTKIELQRVADISSYAGGLRAASTATGVPASCAAAKYALSCAQTNAAADLAETNAVTGTSSRSWSDATLTLSDNMVQAAVVPGIRSAKDVAVTVTVSRSLPSILAYPVDGEANYTVSATATSEVVPSTTTTGPQPCLASLSGNVTFSGGNLDLNGGCSLRSNAAVSLIGTLNATAIYAATTISGYANHVTEYTNAGQIGDPYASNSAIQAAFNQLTTQTSKSFSGGGNGATISPGIYSSINISGSNGTTMSPGLYIVTGNFSVTGSNANVSGSGVTIVVGGTVNIAGSGGSNFNVSAPGTSASNGAIPGILLADNGTSGGTIGSSNAAAISGAIYFPNSTFTLNGTTNAQNSCLEVIAGSITVNGNESFAGSNCSSLGAASFGSMPGAASVALVQ